jgi:hypothetical protein
MFPYTLQEVKWYGGDILKMLFELLPVFLTYKLSHSSSVELYLAMTIQ